MILFLCMILFSGYKIVTYFIGNYENKKIQQSLNNKIVILKPTSFEDEKKSFYQIDFDTLKKENTDTVGYLEVRGTNINYVVVQGRDNQYYLKHNYNKSWNTSGWIFNDYRNTLDGSDRNIIIFGHSIRDGSMFGSLKNIFDEEWRSNKDNLEIVFVTEMGTFYYQVFSTYEIIPEEYYLQTDFKTDEEFDSFIHKIQLRSHYNYQVDVSSTDQILTLSTCNAIGNKRIVLHAKLVHKNGELNNE